MAYTNVASGNRNHQAVATFKVDLDGVLNPAIATTAGRNRLLRPGAPGGLALGASGSRGAWFSGRLVLGAPGHGWRGHWPSGRGPGQWGAGSRGQRRGRRGHRGQSHQGGKSRGQSHAGKITRDGCNSVDPFRFDGAVGRSQIPGGGRAPGRCPLWLIGAKPADTTDFIPQWRGRVGKTADIRRCPTD
jgi:hypothetical protein